LTETRKGINYVKKEMPKKCSTTNKIMKCLWVFCNFSWSSQLHLSKKK